MPSGATAAKNRHPKGYRYSARPRSLVSSGTARMEKPVANSGEKSPAQPNTRRGWERSDIIQAALAVISFAALAVAIIATVLSCDAASKADRLATNLASASLVLPSFTYLNTTKVGGTYHVNLTLKNQGGGWASYIKADLGTLHNIANVHISNSCPNPVQSYKVIFSGTALGASNTLSGKAMVPASVLPPNGTPVNSMMLRVFWNNADGSRRVSCLNLRNSSRLGNLFMAPPK